MLVYQRVTPPNSGAKKSQKKTKIEDDLGTKVESHGICRGMQQCHGGDIGYIGALEEWRFHDFMEVSGDVMHVNGC